jgi:hypothetical protein
MKLPPIVVEVVIFAVMYIWMWIFIFSLDD